mmetsp:Transcript_18541/g.17623  ORF Transcript_18541/g.17623 Transcript_18541/m.17623 type:complete len:174 (+) Transcript_18541:1908-2429(+)
MFNSVPNVYSSSDKNFIIKKCQFNPRLDTSSKKVDKSSLSLKLRIQQRDISSQQNESLAGGIYNVTQIKAKDPREEKHCPCKRFLERGNKPVPPNYEEQDVYPVQGMTDWNKAPGQVQARKVRQRGMNKSFNIEDFDEEINGVNLSKLFSVYGPGSYQQKKKVSNLKGILEVK